MFANCEKIWLDNRYRVYNPENFDETFGFADSKEDAKTIALEHGYSDVLMDDANDLRFRFLEKDGLEIFQKVNVTSLQEKAEGSTFYIAWGRWKVSDKEPAGEYMTYLIGNNYEDKQFHCMQGHYFSTSHYAVSNPVEAKMACVQDFQKRVDKEKQRVISFDKAYKQRKQLSR